jgi:chromosome partitioning protein
MRTIAIANQKGGCGKTTSAVNIAASFARHGRRTLIMDLDPQGHSTLGLGHNPETLDKTIYHALTNAQIPLPRVIIGTSMEGLDLAPSNILLSGAELELASVAGREFVLSEQFRLVSDQYDVCVMDCPPSLGLLTLNALVASTDVIVPVQVNYFAMEGLRQLLETADIIKMNFQPCYVKILGLLLTFVEDRTLLSRQIQQQMREYFGDLVFETVIHRTVRLAEAPSAGESILTFAPNSRGAAEYMALVQEIITREEGPQEKTTVEETAGIEETVGEAGEGEEVREKGREETGEETLDEVESQDQLTPLTEEIRNAKK